MTMDDSSAMQIQNLKNLNSMLLEQSSQQRQQIESLLHAKQALQSALDPPAMAEKVTEAHFSEAAEKNEFLELEKAVLFVFVETQVTEMGFQFDRLIGERNEIERALSVAESEVAVFKGEVDELTLCLENERLQLSKLSREREQMKIELDGVVAEIKGLAEKLLETENRERKVIEEVEKLRLEGEMLLKEGCEKERVIEELKTERDLAVRTSEESLKVIEMLKQEIEGVMREKNENEKVKNAQQLRIIGLEFDLKQLDESLKNSRYEGALMRAKLIELEGSLSLAMKKEEEMELEMKSLLREKKEMEKSIEMLIERKESIKMLLDMVQKDLEDKQRQVDETIKARDDIEQVKVMHENEIMELQREVDRLRLVEHKLEEKNKELLSEVNHLKNSLDEEMIEKGNYRKRFYEEKNKMEKLMMQVAEMEGRMEQTAAELDQMRSERDKVIERNKMMESQMGVLTREKDALERNLLKVQQENDDLRVKFEFSYVNSKQTLAMLKNTAAFVCNHEDSINAEEVVSNGNKFEEEIQPYAEELDAIKNAFKSKNEMVDGMKEQLELLQKSVAEAHQSRKSKGLLPLISSATIFAAALAAFVVRGR